MWSCSSHTTPLHVDEFVGSMHAFHTWHTSCRNCTSPLSSAATGRQHHAHRYQHHATAVTASSSSAHRRPQAMLIPLCRPSCPRQSAQTLSWCRAAVLVALSLARSTARFLVSASSAAFERKLHLLLVVRSPAASVGAGVLVSGTGPRHAEVPGGAPPLGPFGPPPRGGMPPRMWHRITNLRMLHSPSFISSSVFCGVRFDASDRMCAKHWCSGQPSSSSVTPVMVGGANAKSANSLDSR